MKAAYKLDFNYLIFNIEEKINKNSGILDLPSALKSADKILYINMNGSPAK